MIARHETSTDRAISIQGSDPDALAELTDEQVDEHWRRKFQANPEYRALAFDSIYDEDQEFGPPRDGVSDTDDELPVHDCAPMGYTEFDGSESPWSGPGLALIVFIVAIAVFIAGVFNG